MLGFQKRQPFPQPTFVQLWDYVPLHTGEVRLYQAVGEIVPVQSGRNIAALLCGRVDNIEIWEGEHPLVFTICRPDEQGRMAPLPYQDLLLFTPRNSGAENPYGVSLLRPLPFFVVWLSRVPDASSNGSKSMI